MPCHNASSKKELLFLIPSDAKHCGALVKRECVGLALVIGKSVREIHCGT